MKLLLIFPAIFFFPLVGFHPQSADYQDWQAGRVLIYQAYAWNLPSNWAPGLGQLHSASEAASHRNAEVLYQWCLGEYAYLGYRLGNDRDEGLIEERLEALEARLGDLLDLRPNFPAAMAMKGAVIAMQIGLSPMTAVYRGPTSAGLIEDAVEASPDCPEAWVEMGNMRYHTPSLLGGDKQAAIHAFAKAADLFEAQGKVTNNWLYLHTLAWLGQAYADAGQVAAARQAYQRALAAEPNFQWVKDELLPRLAG